MSNIDQFEELLRSDEELQSKLIQALEAYEGDRDDAQALFNAVVAPLAQDAGLPFTYEEFAEQVSKGVELTGEEMDSMSGGWSYCWGTGITNEVDANHCGNEYCGAKMCAYIGTGYLITL